MLWCLEPRLCITRPAVPDTFVYKSNTTKSTYTLNTHYMTFEDAQQYCNDTGGHLAGWDSRAEQLEVEQYYISQASAHLAIQFGSLLWLLCSQA
jgi:hypothetical protein